MGVGSAGGVSCIEPWDGGLLATSIRQKCSQHTHDARRLTKDETAEDR